MNLADILLWKFTGYIESGKIVVQDDGDGPYIAKWDESLGPIPTAEDLAAWELEVVPLKAEADVRQAKRAEYMPIGDQLDAIWHAMDDGILPKVEPLYTNHKLVKDKYKDR